MTWRLKEKHVGKVCRLRLRLAGLRAPRRGIKIPDILRIFQAILLFQESTDVCHRDTTRPCSVAMETKRNRSNELALSGVWPRQRRPRRKNLLKRPTNIPAVHPWSKDDDGRKNCCCSPSAVLRSGAAEEWYRQGSVQFHTASCLCPCLAQSHDFFHSGSSLHDLRTSSHAETSPSAHLNAR